MKIVNVCCGFMKCMKAILAVMNPTYEVVELKPENNFFQALFPLPLK